MKRSAFLQPLSREHHGALSLASACARAAQSGDAAKIAETCERAVRAFAVELEPHFRIEERSLLPRLLDAEAQPLVQRTLDEHRLLRALLDGLGRNDAEALAEFGAQLAAHVRFEERTLFPAIERALEV
ncbi:hemerythrin domain-containing protein [Thiobacillus sedimenti]|uniref:Hemerythrin domain-containing protein n=1 Tax=Thiobacillus sedimenti TaxID=3110231 RepID=A0ABZ1CH90_9PROT|nr:hemerythrin domain-containing protein [Thiobacillus sp. SCUT-2]WRS38746.1 hemerythrin domain-containing protein [Thiobacillus sp. SCUT-2]